MAKKLQIDLHEIDPRKIKERRQELDLTQKRLGELVGLKQSYINKIESGTVPGADKFLDICDALNVTDPRFFSRKKKKLQKSQNLGKRVANLAS